MLVLLCDLQLKKVIKRVASELSELGLTSEVLKDILESNNEAVPPPPIQELSTEEAANVKTTTRPSTPSTPTGLEPNGHGRLRAQVDEDSSDEESGKDAHSKFNKGLKPDSPPERRGKPARKRRAHATYEFAGWSPHAPCTRRPDRRLTLFALTHRHAREPRASDPDRVLFRLVRVCFGPLRRAHLPRLAVVRHLDPFRPPHNPGNEPRPLHLSQTSHHRTSGLGL